MNKKLITLIFLTFCFALLVAIPAFADTTTKRLSGDDRYKTAVAIAEEYNSGTVDSVVLVPGNSYANALPASVLAYQKNAPILLLAGTASGSTDAFGYVTSHLSKTGTVYLVGDSNLIGSDFSNKLSSMGYTNIKSILGKDKYDTDYLVAKELNVPQGTPVVISSGENFPDALAISGYAARNGYPIILTDPNNVSSQALSYITTLAPKTVYITGGTGAVSANVESQIKNAVSSTTIQRFAGTDRYDTASKIIDNFSAGNGSELFVTSGQNYPDALAGSVLVAKKQGAMILIDPGKSTVPDAHVAFLKGLVTKSTNVRVFGGTGVVPEGLSSNVNNLLQGKDQVIPVKIPEPVPQSKLTSGVWYTPKYQEAFCNTVDFYSDGVYVGLKYSDIYSFDPYVTLYNEVMKPIVTTKHRTIGGSFHEGLMSVGDSAGADILYGFIDKTGKEIIAPKYYKVSDFKNGRAIAHLKDSSGKVTTQVIDKTGNVIFRFNDLIYGQVGDDFIHFSATWIKTADLPDQNDNIYKDRFGNPHLFYDFNGKNISMSDIERSFPNVTYTEEWLREVPSYRYNSSEEGAFKASYASLYGDSKYLGNGFFLVSKLTPITGNDWDDYYASQANAGQKSLVDKNNKVIVPMGDIEITPILTETSQFFVVKDNGANKTLSGIYSPTGKVLVKGEYAPIDVFYAGNDGVYYYLQYNQGWGIISLSGTPIVKFSKNWLSTFNYRNGDYSAGSLRNVNDFMNITPALYTTFFTTTNFNVKADTTSLKEVTAQASAWLKKLGPAPKEASSLLYYNRIKTKLTNHIGYANTLIASKNPTWIDVSSVEAELLMWTSQVVPGNDKDN